MTLTAKSVVAIVAIVVASALGWWFGEQRRALDVPYRVVDVLDGDTIVVRRAGGANETVRILGVDTPETHHPTKPVGCYGPEASAFTSRRLFGQVVTLEDDVQRRDIYHRRLAYVYLHGERFNDVLLRRGYARLLVIAPNGAHARMMLDEELDAEQHGRGLWGACG
ncbi:MAG: thermonuclease family protein, partial [Acidimicrobiia bacterium]